MVRFSVMPHDEGGVERGTVVVRAIFKASYFLVDLVCLCVAFGQHAQRVPNTLFQAFPEDARDTHVFLPFLLLLWEFLLLHISACLRSTFALQRRRKGGNWTFPAHTFFLSHSHAKRHTHTFSLSLLDSTVPFFLLVDSAQNRQTNKQTYPSLYSVRSCHSTTTKARRRHAPPPPTFLPSCSCCSHGPFPPPLFPCSPRRSDTRAP